MQACQAGKRGKAALLKAGSGATLPPEVAKMKTPPPLMVTVANCRDWSQTQIVKATLESRGISAFAPDELSNLDGLIMHYGGFRVEVASQDAEAARKVLEELEADGPPQPTP
jgi:hypothetical protein